MRVYKKLDESEDDYYDDDDDDDDEDYYYNRKEFVQRDSREASKKLLTKSKPSRPRIYSYKKLQNHIGLNKAKVTRPLSLNEPNNVSNYEQLMRYPINHRQVPSNRTYNQQATADTDVRYFFIFLILLFVSVITLTQIIIMHGMNNRNSSSYSQMESMREELKQMDLSIDKMIAEDNVLPIHQWRPLKAHLNNINKFKKIFIRTFIENNTYLNDHCNYDVVGNLSLPVDFSHSNLNRRMYNTFGRNSSNIKDCFGNLVRLFLATSQSAHEQNESEHENLKNFSYNTTFEYFTSSIIAIEKSTFLMWNNNTPLCKRIPESLIGSINVSDYKPDNVNMLTVIKNNTMVQNGGKWKPSTCKARHKIAIIIPYRDRQEHLILLLAYLHPLLQRQELDYKIYVVEQFGNGTFNKAILMNAAFIYAFDEENFDCVCFHDVDLIPEDDRNMYTCPKNPRHMSVAVNEMNYKLQYEELVGGVLILRPEHVLSVNGYSNLYWGWGAEDDDLYYRIKGTGLNVERPPVKLARYTMIKHEKRKPQVWSKRAKLLYSSVSRKVWDGISSVKYKLLNRTIEKLYTHLLINVGEAPRGFN